MYYFILMYRWCEAVNSSHGLFLLGHWGNEGRFDALKIKSISAINDGHGAVVSYNISIDPMGDHQTLANTWSGRRQFRHRRTDSELESGQLMATPGQLMATPGLIPGLMVATDALALVDTPGEYWIDRPMLRLYYIPQTLPGRLFLALTPSLTSPQVGLSWTVSVGLPRVNCVNLSLYLDCLKLTAVLEAFSPSDHEVTV